LEAEKPQIRVLQIEVLAADFPPPPPIKFPSAAAEWAVSAGIFPPPPPIELGCTVQTSSFSKLPIANDDQ
jgi:hypothetical protein